MAITFPQHGVTTDPDGHFVLVLPAYRVMHEVLKRRSAKSLPRPKDGVLHPANTFQSTLSLLEICLNELSTFDELVATSPGIDFVSDPDVVRVCTLTPLYLDSGFSLLRRLADHMTKALAPLAFRDYESAPREFNKLIRLLASDDAQIATLSPLVDLHSLRRAVMGNRRWFDSLRGTDQQGRKGIRDTLEHRLTYLQAGLQQTGQKPPRLTATAYGIEADVDVRRELVSELKEIVRGFCALMTALVSCVAFGEDFAPADWLRIKRRSHIRFWPYLS